MRPLALLAGASLPLLVVAVACDDATKPPFQPTAAPSATSRATATVATTPTATSTPPPAEAPGLAGFRQFAASIDAALAGGDSSFFSDRGVEEELTCAGDEQLGPCVEQPAGTELEGVWRGLWRSDAVDLAPPAEIAASFESFVADALGGESDTFGAGDALLYALASSQQGAFGGAEAFYAVVTAIAPSDAGPERRIQVYQFTFDGELWRLLGVIEAGVLFEEWLSGDCADCYEQWERWEGTA